MAATVELSNDFEIEDVLGQIEDHDIVDYAGAGNLLSEIDMAEAVKHYEPDQILDHIGKQAAMEYWELIEPPAEDNQTPPNG